MTQNAVDEKKSKLEALKARSADMDKREKELNSGKSGKGLRTILAMTRGKNPTEIQYEAFDESDSKSLPETTSEFLDITKVQDDKLLVSYLIEGYNSAAYSGASDPVNDFVEASWPPDFAKSFKAVVKSYAANNGLSIEDAVAVIKPVLVFSNK